MSHEPNAILAISSTDRYTTYLKGNANQPTQNVLIAQYVRTRVGTGPKEHNLNKAELGGIRRN